MQPLHEDATAAELVPGLAAALVLLSLAVLLALLIVHRLRDARARGHEATHGAGAAGDDAAGDDAGDAALHEDPVAADADDEGTDEDGR